MKIITRSRLLSCVLLSVLVGVFSAPAASPNDSSTSTASAASSVPTISYASDDPNDVEFGTTSPTRGALGGSVIGPNNAPLDLENPDLLAPPTTDEGIIPSIKWPFSLSWTRLQTGGWARQQNINQMPIATEIAGVDMFLEPGAYREMHWHNTAEWAYMLKGGTRISTLTPDGQIYVADVNKGDLWYFPAGNPHSIQALGPADCPDASNSTSGNDTSNAECDYNEGAEFLLVFDSGKFNEDATFLLTDWLAHTPKSVLARNFQQPASAFADIPGKELYIFPGTPPAKDIKEDMVVPNDTPEPYAYEFSKIAPTPKPGGSIKIADSTNFKVAKTIAVQEVEVEVGGMREMHWHPTQPEWTFFLEGEARMTVYASSATANTYDFQAGDVAYVPATYGHYIDNIGNTTLKLLEIFKSDRVRDISLQQWLALTPHDIVKAHLGLSDDTIDKFDTTKLEVV